MRSSSLRYTLLSLLMGMAFVLGASATASGLGFSQPSHNAGAIAARTVATDLGRFRSSLNADLDSYLARYGSRLSPAEAQRVRVLQRQTMRDLRDVQRSVSRVARWDREAKPVQHRRAAAAAYARYENAYARADRAIAELRPMLQPKLNLFEALDASQALDSRMAEYRKLGLRIRDLR